MASNKLWGGRFSQDLQKEALLFSESLSIDLRLWHADITCSMIHAEMLGRVGAIPKADSQTIVSALAKMRQEWEKNPGSLPREAEDIHTAIESALAKKIGALAGKLHTARSRNDQVVTSLRLYLRSEVLGFAQEIWELQKKLLEQAQQHTNTLLPGMTHLQHAQPVSLAHHLLAYFWMFERDQQRIKDFFPRLNHLPLGSGALAGSAFSLDREFVAKKLGFTSVSENSLDAVSDRDFVLEFLAIASTHAMHLSRLAEEIVLWSTREFSFIELSDSVSTGSSLMPQKKNPDLAELTRGKAARVFAAHNAMLIVTKALPLAYNRDLQEDKFHLFTALDAIRGCTRITLLQFQNIRFNVQKMAEACARDFSNATDLADYLVRKKVPFREAHQIAGQIVLKLIKLGKGLEDLSAKELSQMDPRLGEDLVPLLKPASVMESRNTSGGTGLKAVAEQLKRAKRLSGPALAG